MGWPWSSWSSPSPSSQEQASSEPLQSTAEVTPPQSSPLPPLPPLPPPVQERPASTVRTTDQTSSSHQNAPSKKTRDEQANEDLLAFLYALEASYKNPPPSPADDEETGPIDPNAPALITPAHIYPVRLSCTLLFDSAFHCSSPLGQFLNVYRYGTFRPCNRLWNEFLWCMRTNRGFMSVAEREERTLRKGWQRERDRLVERGGTSEEVWERRRWMVKDAFAEGWGPSVEKRGDWPDEQPSGEDKKEIGRFSITDQNTAGSVLQ